jgi:hypothetical protein
VRCFAECRGAVENDGVEIKLDGANVIVENGGSTYALRSDARAWDDAKSACEEEDAHLLVENDASERDFVQATVSPGWIGLSDQGSEGEFVWIDGTALDFTAWNAGEPNEANAGEDCVTDFGGWNDDACTNTYNYVCEAD